MSRLQRLLGARSNNVQYLCYDELSKPYQRALVWDMALDGGYWPCPVQWPDDGRRLSLEEILRDVERALPSFAVHAAERRYGVMSRSTELLKREFMLETEIGEEFPNFDAYHAWYLSQGDTPEYSSEERWPSILSSFPRDVLQDGNHRFHSYVRAGHADIPLLFFTEKSEGHEYCLGTNKS